MAKKIASISFYRAPRRKPFFFFLLRFFHSKEVLYLSVLNPKCLANHSFVAFWSVVLKNTPTMLATRFLMVLFVYSKRFKSLIVKSHSGVSKVVLVISILNHGKSFMAVFFNT
jgi:hypothetical protein